MRCDEAKDLLSEHLEEALLTEEVAALERHLGGCGDCERELSELRAVRFLLRAVPQEPLPAGLEARIHAALMALPDAGTDAAAPFLAAAPVALRPESFWRKTFNWPSLMGGVAVAAAVIGFWQMQPGNLPRIETAAVSVKTDVAMNIGFDVDQSMDNVTFQINLPEGLQFVDERSQPLMAQSVSWKGSLKKGNTLIPIVVRGVRPGRYEVEAYVKKGPMMRKTTIVLPVQAT